MLQNRDGLRPRFFESARSLDWRSSQRRRKPSTSIWWWRCREKR